ncbi:MAG TPA: response regulator [Gemmataceae bacterium]|nr:response regulator [Gemmataceae bacterium]
MQSPRRLVAVIDDDVSVRGALLRLFRTAGLDVSLFAAAEEYLASPNGANFACLVIDMRLPGMSGLELLEKLHTDSPKPALVITAHEDEQTRTKAFALGAVGFFRKPCDNRQLLDAVHGVLDRRDTRADGLSPGED